MSAEDAEGDDTVPNSPVARKRTLSDASNEAGNDTALMRSDSDSNSDSDSKPRAKERNPKNARKARRKIRKKRSAGRRHKDFDSNIDPVAKPTTGRKGHSDSDSDSDRDGKPRAKERTIQKLSTLARKARKKRNPVESFDKDRTERLKNRHDPSILEQKQERSRARKVLLKEKREKAAEQLQRRAQMEEDDAVTYANETRLFNEFYNKNLRSALRNNRKTETDKSKEDRFKKAEVEVKNFLLQKFPEGPSSTIPSEQTLEPADIIQKLYYEPPIGEKTQDSFTVIYEDGSKEYLVTTQWLDWAIGPAMVAMALKIGKRIYELKSQQIAFILPSGDSNRDLAPESCLVKFNEKRDRQKKIMYQQGDSNYCFMYSFASALHYIGKTEEARTVKNKAAKFSNMALVEQLKRLVDLATKKMEGIIPDKKKHNFKDSTMAQLIEAATKEQLMIVVPKAKGRSTTHAVTICMGLVFDSTQEYPLYPVQETFEFISGSSGFEKTYMTRSFRVLFP
jgi:hypothetical protein